MREVKFELPCYRDTLCWECEVYIVVKFTYLWCYILSFSVRLSARADAAFSCSYLCIVHVLFLFVCLCVV